MGEEFLLFFFEGELFFLCDFLSDTSSFDIINDVFMELM